MRSVTGFHSFFWSFDGYPTYTKRKSSTQAPQTSWNTVDFSALIGDT